jgi:DNA-binding CsgD family transcriptional regulator
MPDRADSEVLELQAGDQDAALDRSALDHLAWIDALRALPTPPPTERDIVTWVDDALRRFLPFSGFLGAYGKWSGGRIHVLSWLASGHCPEYVASRPRVFDLNTRAAVAWWIYHQKPFLSDDKGCVDEDGAPIPASEVDLESNLRFSLGLMAVHGVIDPVGKCGTYICLSGIPRAQSKRFLAALKLIAPVLHTLFLQTRRMTFADLTVLTDRQRELLDLALVGLSDKAIAARLRISDHTVGHHFQAIYAKLGVTKRSQLIALLK